jgi:hypothetical protein
MGMINMGSASDSTDQYTVYDIYGGTDSTECVSTVISNTAIVDWQGLAQQQVQLGGAFQAPSREYMGVDYGFESIGKPKYIAFVDQLRHSIDVEWLGDIEI